MVGFTVTPVSGVADVLLRLQRRTDGPEPGLGRGQLARVGMRRMAGWKSWCRLMRPIYVSGEYYSLCASTGDFDVQARYELSTWLTQNGVRMGIGLRRLRVVCRRTLNDAVSDSTGDVFDRSSGGVWLSRRLTSRTGCAVVRSGTTANGADYLYDLRQRGRCAVSTPFPSLLVATDVPTSSCGKPTQRPSVREARSGKLAFNDFVVNAGGFDCDDVFVRYLLANVNPSYRASGPDGQIGQTLGNATRRRRHRGDLPGRQPCRSTARR